MQNVVFEVPAENIIGLATGRLRRIGPVIRETETGRIVNYMRETSVLPVQNVHLASGMVPQLQNMLALASPVLPLLNLGATMAFGAATLSKLGKMDRKLDRIEQKIDIIDAKLDELSAKINRIEWAVDVGFASTLRSLGVLERYAEASINGKLTAAAQAAWSAQFLEPESTQRMVRIENALANAGEATEQLALLVYGMLESALMQIRKSRTKKASLSVGEDAVSALQRMRQLIVACSVRANILCESGDIYTAAQLTKGHADRLSGILMEMGQAYLGIGSQSAYQLLIDGKFLEVMPAERLDRWVMRFDPELGGMAGLLDVVRASGHFDNALPENMWRIRYFGAERIEAPKTRKPDGNQVSFFDLVDGCWEDLDRLSGSALEMESVANGAGSWQAHRELLWLETVPDEATIAWFSCAHQEHLAA